MDLSRDWAEAMLTLEGIGVTPATAGDVRTFLCSELPKALPLDAVHLAALRSSGTTHRESALFAVCGNASSLACSVAYVSLASNI